MSVTEAAAEIDMLRNLVDERTNDAAKEWERAEAAEARLATLLAPSEGDKTTAEERANARRIISDVLKVQTPTVAPKHEGLVHIRLLDDLDHATAQARSAVDAARAFDPGDEFIRPENYEEVLYSQDFIDAMSALTERKAYTKQACAMLIAEQSIRARRKGETGNG